MGWFVISGFSRRLAASARFLKGTWDAPFVPEEVIFEVTTACNLACPMCARTHLSEPRKPVSLSQDDFLKLAVRLPSGVQRVAIAGLGEPLLNRDLPAMVSYLSSRGVGAVLYTNATLLTREISEQLVGGGLAGIVIPVDGASAATYEKYRKNGCFAQTVANVRALLEVKERLGASLFVEVQMLDLPGTRQELPAWRAMWAGCGVDALRFKADHMGVDGGGPPAGAGGGSGTGRETGTGRDTQTGTDTGVGRCPMPWRGPATVDVHGRVYPCCVQSPENANLGNLFEQDLDTIWNGPEALRVRREFARTRRKLSTCQGCTIPLPREWIAALGNLVDPFTARRVLARAERFWPWLSHGGKS